MKTRRVLHLLCALAVAAPCLLPQQTTGFKDEYLNEFDLTSKHLLQLADATPAEKLAWRPAPGVRSIGEVYVHIAFGNYLLTHFAGATLPSEYFPDSSNLNAILARSTYLEKNVTAKADVQRLLTASLDSVRQQIAALTPADLDKPVDFFGQKTTARGIYFRELAHVNEHYGQSVAYARTNGIVPPWSRKTGQ